MKNVTKTADLSEYTDEQIKIMFSNANLFGVVQNVVKFLKETKDLTGRHDSNTFEYLSIRQQILDVFSQTCKNESIDPKLLGLK